MANYPKKMNDPTEAALSAIQEALNVREEDEQPTSPAAATPDLFTSPAESPEVIADAVVIEGQSVKAPGTGDAADIAGRAANDDQQAIGLGAAALLPIIFFFGVAHMAWRAQELRVIAQSMARVAMRLAEPESVARDSIVTVGQAIRREVAAMGDGVERALARASELEALVQSEVAALERTYSDNEVRIRGLLQDLAN